MELKITSLTIYCLLVVKGSLGLEIRTQTDPVIRKRVVKQEKIVELFVRLKRKAEYAVSRLDKSKKRFGLEIASDRKLSRYYDDVLHVCYKDLSQDVNWARSKAFLLLQYQIGAYKEVFLGIEAYTGSKSQTDRDRFYDKVIAIVNSTSNLLEENSPNLCPQKRFDEYFFRSLIVGIIQECEHNLCLVELFIINQDILKRNIASQRSNENVKFIFYKIIYNFVNLGATDETEATILNSLIYKIYDICCCMQLDSGLTFGLYNDQYMEKQKTFKALTKNDMTFCAIIDYFEEADPEGFFRNYQKYIESGMTYLMLYKKIETVKRDEFFTALRQYCNPWLGSIFSYIYNALSYCKPFHIFFSAQNVAKLAFLEKFEEYSYQKKGINDKIYIIPTENIDLVLDFLRKNPEHNYNINIRKSEFMSDCMEFVGIKINRDVFDICPLSQTIMVKPAYHKDNKLICIDLSCIIEFWLHQTLLIRMCTFRFKNFIGGKICDIRDFNADEKKHKLVAGLYERAGSFAKYLENYVQYSRMCNGCATFDDLVTLVVNNFFKNNLDRQEIFNNYLTLKGKKREVKFTLRD